MKNGIHFVALVLSLSAFGCGTSPVKGSFLSGERNIWIADPNSADVSYCVANTDGVKADPICYMAHRAQVSESGYVPPRRAYQTPAASIAPPSMAGDSSSNSSAGASQSTPAKKE